MTDAEIMKALECFAIDKDSDETYCVGCAFETKGLCCENCSEGIAKASLDLINRQKAEIERIEKEKNTFAKRFYKEGIKDLAERLKEELRLSTGNNGGFVPSMIDNLVKEMAGDTE